MKKIEEGRAKVIVLDSHRMVAWTRRQTNFCATISLEHVHGVL